MTETSERAVADLFAVLDAAIEKLGVAREKLGVAQAAETLETKRGTSTELASKTRNPQESSRLSVVGVVGVESHHPREKLPDSQTKNESDRAEKSRASTPIKTTPTTPTTPTIEDPCGFEGKKQLALESFQNRCTTSTEDSCQPVRQDSRVSLTSESQNQSQNADAERAAIVEFDADVPREWAEGFARLHPDRPLGDTPSARWVRLIDDIDSFLDAGWGVKASALGWGPLELFGCDRERPFARIDQCGLLWLLNGRRLVIVTADTAVIETVTGARLTYRRKPTGPGSVLPWELAK